MRAVAGGVCDLLLRPGWADSITIGLTVLGLGARSVRSLTSGRFTLCNPGGIRHRRRLKTSPMKPSRSQIPFLLRVGFVGLETVVLGLSAIGFFAGSERLMAAYGDTFGVVWMSSCAVLLLCSIALLFFDCRLAISGFPPSLTAKTVKTAKTRVLSVLAVPWPGGSA
jgi:hypothetical protein